MLKTVSPSAVSDFAVPGLVYGALLSSGPTPTTAGTGYVPGDQITLTGGTFTSAATLRVSNTKVVSATITAGGTGGTSGTQTVTGTTGTLGLTGQLFAASVTIAGGAITAVLSITIAGNYIVNPTTLGAEPVTGAGLVGATLNLTMGVLNFIVQTVGAYSSIPGSPVTMSQGSTSGVGTGATFPISFAPISCNIPYASNNENHTAAADTLFIGNGAGAANTTGYFNLAIGVDALQLNTTGPESVAIGWHALQNYVGTGGSGNVALGTAAGRTLTTGTTNICIGTDAVNGPTVCSDVIAIGASAGGAGVGNDVGGTNVFIGSAAGKNGTNARISNVVIGYQAAFGGAGSAGTRNTVIGNQAMFSVNSTSAARNVAVGDGTLATVTSSSDNVVLGSQAGAALTSNGACVLIGSNTGNLISGANNTCIGKNVAQTTLTTGSNNVLIGTNSSIDTAAASTSNTIAIGAGSTAIISATGCGTPSTSTATIAGLLTVTGAATPTGGIAAAGGFSVSPRLCHTGGVGGTLATSAFTAQTPVVTEFYFAEVFIPANCTITGVGVLNSATISGNMKVGLANSAGTIVATSASTAMAGTSVFQRVPFTGTYAAVGPATYFVCVSYDNTTVRPNTHTVGNFGASKSTGQVFATGFTTITPPTTFTTALGPVGTLY